MHISARFSHLLRTSLADVRAQHFCVVLRFLSGFLKFQIHRCMYHRSLHWKWRECAQCARPIKSAYLRFAARASWHSVQTISLCACTFLLFCCFFCVCISVSLALRPFYSFILNTSVVLLYSLLCARISYISFASECSFFCCTRNEPAIHLTKQPHGYSHVCLHDASVFVPFFCSIHFITPLFLRHERKKKHDRAILIIACDSRGHSDV